MASLPLATTHEGDGQGDNLSLVPPGMNMRYVLDGLPTRRNQSSRTADAPQEDDEENDEAAPAR